MTSAALITLCAAGCKANPADAKTSDSSPDPLVMQAAPPVSQEPVATPVEVSDTAISAVATSGLPTDFTPSANLADVIKLVRSGVSEELLRTFIKNTEGSFALGAAGIVYLHDLGMSDDLINTMLIHDNQPPLAAQTTVEVLPQSSDSAPVVADETVETTPPMIVVEEPAPVTVNYFYTTLSPYGTWVDVEGYGRCWQPTLVYAQPGWQPYCDNGHWVYTSHGWMWVSGYSWGFTFHYGRWFHHPRRGWCWWPDTAWGPAWVSWREANDYCGWAPLPPFTTWVSGSGLYYRGSAVGIGFNFGLSANCYTFVPRSHFIDRHPWEHALPRTRVTQVVNQTTIVNNFTPDRNGRIFNRGFGRFEQSHDSGLPSQSRPRRVETADRPSIVTTPSNPLPRTQTPVPNTGRTYPRGENRTVDSGRPTGAPVMTTPPTTTPPLSIPPRATERQADQPRSFPGNNQPRGQRPDEDRPRILLPNTSTPPVDQSRPRIENRGDNPASHQGRPIHTTVTTIPQPSHPITPTPTIMPPSPAQRGAPNVIIPPTQTTVPTTTPPSQTRPSSRNNPWQPAGNTDSRRFPTTRIQPPSVERPTTPPQPRVQTPIALQPSSRVNVNAQVISRPRLENSIPRQQNVRENPGAPVMMPYTPRPLPAIQQRGSTATSQAANPNNDSSRRNNEERGRGNRR